MQKFIHLTCIKFLLAVWDFGFHCYRNVCSDNSKLCYYIIGQFFLRSMKLHIDQIDLHVF